MIYLYLFGTCFHFIYVFMIIDKYLKPYLLKMKHPMANEIIRNTSSMIYLKLFIASLLSSKQVCRLKNTFK